jgi:hypothetical protein
MITPDLRNNLSIEEQILQAQKKYADLLKADAEFRVLKPHRLKIKMLQEELNQLRKNEIKRNSVPES